MTATRVPGAANRALRRLLYTLLWATLAALIAVGAVVWTFQAWSRGRIYPGVHVLGVHIGGLRPSEALDYLRQTFTGDELPYVTLRSEEQEWVLSAANLGGHLCLEDAVYEAWTLGRSGIFRYDLMTQFRLLWYGYYLVPAFELEPGPALVGLRYVARQATHPARPAQMWLGGLQARTESSHVGWDLDIIAIREEITRRVNAELGTSHWLSTPRLMLLLDNRPVAASQPVPELPPVALRHQEVHPPLTEVQGASDAANAILSAPLRLVATLEEFDAQGHRTTVQRRWIIDQATLASWLTLEREEAANGALIRVDLDRERVSAYVRNLAQIIARLPQEPRFDYHPPSATLTTVSPGRTGYALDVSQTVERIIAAANDLDAREVSLPLHAIRPRVTREDLEALMPLSLISVGETSFAGSSSDRAQNIRTATAQFHGVVVPPRRTFSFLSHLGQVTLANGYSQSWIIYGDRTILGPGGGVCQVSTTAFRAAFWGGYPIEERWPHSYRVSWYEPPLGLDAAVFSPGTDFQFLNDTDTPILILTEVDDAHGRLYFRFYGAPRNRDVRLEGPVTSRPVSAPPPVIVEDPTLPPGERVLDERARDGLDVTLYRVIESSGQILSREEFFSRYEAWPARYRVGPTPSE